MFTTNTDDRQVDIYRFFFYKNMNCLHLKSDMWIKRMNHERAEALTSI